MKVVMAILLHAASWLRGLMIPAMAIFARLKLDKPYNYCSGDLEARLRFFADPMSISKALREQPEQHAIYKEISQTGLIPAAFLLHGPDTLLLAGFWGLMREAFDADGRVPRDVLEVFAAEVSHLARCRLCVSVHAAFMDGMGYGEAARFYHRERSSQRSEKLSQRHRMFVDWMSTYPSADFDTDFLHRNFDPQERAELLGTAFAFHYISGIYQVVMADSDFTSLLMKCIGLTRYAGKERFEQLIYGTSVSFIGHFMSRSRPQGGSVTLELIEHSDLELLLPGEMSWAAPNAHIELATAGLWGASHQLATRWLSSAVMALIRDLVANKWDAVLDPSRDSSNWARDAVAGGGLKCETDRIVAEIGLLMALSPWQLNQARGEELLQNHLNRLSSGSAADSDSALLGLLAWSRLQASRKVVARLAGCR